jgi:hypothetical protein
VDNQPKIEMLNAFPVEVALNLEMLTLRTRTSSESASVKTSLLSPLQVKPSITS